MKKIKLLTTLTTLATTGTVLVPLASCGLKETVDLILTQGESTKQLVGSSVTFTFTTNKQMSKSDFNKPELIGSLDFEVSDYDVSGDTLSITFHYKANGTKQENLTVAISTTDSKYNKSFTCTVTNIPIPQITLTLQEESTVGGYITTPKTYTVDQGTAFGSLNPAPAVETQNGYVFDGWYEGNVRITASTTFTANTTITARFVTPAVPTDFTWSLSAQGATVTGYTGTDAFVNIPSTYTSGGDTYNVIAIGDNAFLSSRIERLWIPEYCVSVGKNAFGDCEKLWELTIGAKVKTFGSMALAGDTKLTTINAMNKNMIWTAYDSVNDVIVDQILGSYDSTTLATKMRTYLSDSNISLQWNQFTNDSWTTVIAEARKGLDSLHAVYNVSTMIGLEKVVKLKGVYCRVRVIDEAHDTIFGSSKQANLTFELANLAPITDVIWNDDYSLETRYQDTNLYDVITNQCRSMLEAGQPELFSSADGIKTVVKTVNQYNIDSRVAENKTYTAKVFALTYAEMSGVKIKEKFPTEGTQYTYYKEAKAKSLLSKAMAKKHVGGTENENYWLASPVSYWWVDPAGRGFSGSLYISGGATPKVGEASAKSKMNVAFAFCI